jgi:hypothetical protein
MLVNSQPLYQLSYGGKRTIVCLTELLVGGIKGNYPCSSAKILLIISSGAEITKTIMGARDTRSLRREDRLTRAEEMPCPEGVRVAGGVR